MGVVLDHHLIQPLAILIRLVVHAIVDARHLRHHLRSKGVTARVERRPEPVYEPVYGDDDSIHTSHRNINGSA